MNKQTWLLGVALIISGGIVNASSLSWGTASSFAVIGGTTVTSTGATVVDGNLGVSPGTAVTGFDPPGIVTGSIHAGDAIASQAHADASTAYGALLLLVAGADLTGTDLGARTLAPGVYRFDTSAQLTGDLVLDGAGEYVFLIGSTLTTAADSTIQTINGASWEHVFFQVGSSATLGTGTMFLGSIVADTSVSLSTGASVSGHVFGLGGAVTLDNNTVMVPEPSTAILFLAGVMMLMAWHRRPPGAVSGGAAVPALL